MPRWQILNKNRRDVYKEAIPLKFFMEYYRAVEQNIRVHFQECFPPLKMWIYVTAYPSPEGLSVYFKDVTEKRDIENPIKESKYSRFN